MRSPRLLAALCVALLASASDTALAQRGQDSLPDPSADSDDHRLDFGNSLFRGGALARGEVEVAGPLLAVRYGLSTSTTIGVHVWAIPFLASDGGGALVSLEHHGVWRRWRYGAGVLAGDARATVSGAGLGLRAALLRGHLEYRLSDRHAIGSSILGGGITGTYYGGDGEIMDTYTGIHVDGAISTLNYSASPVRWFGVEASVGGCWLGDLILDDSNGMISTGEQLDGSDRLLGRLQLHLRGRRWRMAVGALYLPAIPAVPIVPSLEIARKW